MASVNTDADPPDKLDRDPPLPTLSPKRNPANEESLIIITTQGEDGKEPSISKKTQSSSDSESDIQYMDATASTNKRKVESSPNEPRHQYSSTESDDQYITQTRKKRTIKNRRDFLSKKQNGDKEATKKQNGASANEKQNGAQANKSNENAPRRQYNKQSTYNIIGVTVKAEGRRAIDKDELKIIQKHMKEADYRCRFIHSQNGTLYVSMSESRFISMNKTFPIRRTIYHVDRNNQGPPKTPVKTSKTPKNNGTQQSRPDRENKTKNPKVFKYVEYRLARYHESESEIKELLNSSWVYQQTGAECLNVEKWDKPIGMSTITFSHKINVSKIRVDNHVYHLDDYVQRVPKCQHCQRWGHMKSYCRVSTITSQQKCSRCGGAHKNDNCQEQIKCANCGLNHAVHDPICTVKIRATKIWEAKASDLNTKKTISTEIATKLRKVESKVLKQTNNTIKIVKKTFAEAVVKNTASTKKISDNMISANQLQAILEKVLAKVPSFADVVKTSKLIKKAITSVMEPTLESKTPVKQTTERPVSNVSFLPPLPTTPVNTPNNKHPSARSAAKKPRSYLAPASLVYIDNQSDTDTSE